MYTKADMEKMHVDTLKTEKIKFNISTLIGQISRALIGSPVSAKIAKFVSLIFPTLAASLCMLPVFHRLGDAWQT